MNKSFIDPTALRARLIAAGDTNHHAMRPAYLGFHSVELGLARSLLIAAQRREARLKDTHQWRPGTGVVPASERYKIAHPKRELS